MTNNDNTTENTGLKQWKRLMFVTCVVLCLEGLPIWGSVTNDQTVFEADTAQQIMNPVPLPKGALQVLSKDKDVVACTKDNPIPHPGSLGSWFAASVVHLNGRGEDDLVVLPIAQGNPYLCFHSVEGIGIFWVFRRAEGQYKLVLKTSGLRLVVLKTTHNGYRDIESEGQVGKFGTRSIFRFESGRYREFRRKTQELQ